MEIFLILLLKYHSSIEIPSLSIIRQLSASNRTKSRRNYLFLYWFFPSTFKKSLSVLNQSYWCFCYFDISKRDEWNKYHVRNNFFLLLYLKLFNLFFAKATYDENIQTFIIKLCVYTERLIRRTSLSIKYKHLPY